MRLTNLYDQEYTKPAPVAGDIIDIEINESTVVETTVAGVDDTGNVLVYLDETAINMIEQRGMLAESIEEDAPALVRGAAGATLGALAGTGGFIFGSIFSPLVGAGAAAYSGYSGAKLGAMAADDIWDWATKKLGGKEEEFAMNHIRAASKGEDSFTANGHEYPVALKPNEVKPAIQAVKQVAESIAEAKYHGKDVTLGKPVRGGPKKFYVYVRDPATKNIKKVNFGDPNMRIKKSSPKHRKSFRARHNCKNPGPRTKARYWSCKAW